MVQVTSIPTSLSLPTTPPLVHTILTEEERDAQREAEQAQLDEEMRKRRERVKAWQDAKALAAADNNGAVAPSEKPSDALPAVNYLEQQDGQTSALAWSLEDDAEDDGIESKEQESFGTPVVDELLLKLPPPSPQQRQEYMVDIAPSPLHSSSSKKTASLTFAMSAIAHAPPALGSAFPAEEAEATDEVDPLDAFMEGLYGGANDGEKPTLQMELSRSASSSSSAVLRNSSLSLSDIEIDESEDVGSNFITLDEIMDIRSGRGISHFLYVISYLSSLIPHPLPRRPSRLGG